MVGAREEYSPQFYASLREAGQRSARIVWPLWIAGEEAPVRSAVDVGCGPGGWLSVLQELGVEQVVGFDGPWVDPRELAIPAGSFREVDLDTVTDLGVRADLVLCLEVAEHLHPARAASFVRLIAGVADRVLWSAAIPGQGGQHHINEAWPSTWARHFANEGFRVDDRLRTQIWSDGRVPPWYRQNLLVFRRVTDGPDPVIPHDLDRVHPEYYERYALSARSAKGSWRHLRRALLRKVPGFRRPLESFERWAAH